MIATFINVLLFVFHIKNNKINVKQKKKKEVIIIRNSVRVHVKKLKNMYFTEILHIIFCYSNVSLNYIILDRSV